MRIVNIDKISAGMRLGEAVRGARGQVLLTRGTILTAAYVATLQTLGVPAVYIADPDTADVEIPQPISAESRTRVLKNISRTFDELAEATEEMRKSSVDEMRHNLEGDLLVRAAAASGVADYLYSLSKDVDLILDELGNQEVLMGLNSIKTHDLYTFQHSIDVTIMALVLAKRARWDRARSRAFGMGCLLHDLGKVMIEPQILNQPGPLTPEQFERLKGHTTMGYELIRSLAPRLGSLTPQVAYQHHERQDGSGYPRGLKGNNRLGENEPGLIHDFGALAAVADVYDAMASHRPYRRALPVDEVVATIGAYAGSHLNAEAVRIFQSVVPPYPVCSSVVMLNGAHEGYQGVVVKVPPRDLSRPIVRLLFDKAGNRVDAIDVSLEADRDLRVQSVRDATSPIHSLGSSPITPQKPKTVYAIPPAVLRALKAG